MKCCLMITLAVLIMAESQFTFNLKQDDNKGLTEVLACGKCRK